MTVPLALAAQAAQATREVQWNVSGSMLAFMYGSMVLALGIFFHGTWRRFRVWRIGRPEVRWDRPWLRARRVLSQVGGHRKFLEERLAGLMHAFIFFGFAALLAATAVVMIHHDLGVPIMRGAFYLYFQSLGVGVLAVLATVGVGIAAYRRWVRPAPHLEHGKRADGMLLSALFLLLATGFLISGLRIAATSDPWGAWRPGSWLTARMLLWMPLDPESLTGLHASLWVFHVALWHTVLAAIPYSKLFHVLSGTASIFAANLRAPGTPGPTDFEDPSGSVTLGVGSALDLTWKQLLEMDACTECGRCQSVCPAWAEGKPLSPKRVILDIRDHVREHKTTLLEAARARAAGDAAGVESILSRMPRLPGEVVRSDTLWACTTCRACEDACPVSIEHVSLILGLRQHLVMERGEAPEGVAEMIRSLEARQHPFRGAARDRAAWLNSPPT